MRRSTIVFDVHPWWQTRRGIFIALASAGVLCSLWWMAIGPSDEVAPDVPPARAERSATTQPLDVGPASSTSPIASPLSPAAAQLPAQAQPMPAPPPPISTMVAPGVHITPLSVPPGTVAMPAGPRPDDSEPEN